MKKEKLTIQECCETLKPTIEKLASQRTVNAIDAEDFYQQCYLSICEHYDAYDATCGTPVEFFPQFFPN